MKKSVRFPKLFASMQSFFTIQKTIAITLIFTLILTQTFQFSFFGVANAHADKYRDVVSLVVDDETYRILRSKIERYSEDIQKQLGSTRVVISVIDKNTTPAMIATHNEKLYYESEDTDGVKTRLVGTVLIGNVPIPMVHAEGKYFPSIFPYVDFDNKAFVYNDDSWWYEQSSLSSDAIAVEIWHGVMNPAVGREWNTSEDVERISQFLDKTHDFYEKTGRFSMQTEPPRVFYFDGFAEGKSIGARQAFQYGLWQANIRNLMYNRFSKHFLRDVNQALKDYDKSTEDEDYTALLAEHGIDQSIINSASDSLPESVIKNVPDIHTATILKNILLPIDKILNKKTLGEEFAAVHNAGRYNSGATVNADLVAVRMSLMDDVAVDTIKKANDALEMWFAQFLEENSIARRIPIVDGVTTRVGNDFASQFTNYFFGIEGKNIMHPSQCTIARWYAGQTDTFGKSVLTEANVAFDVNSAERHLEELNSFRGGYCFAWSLPRIDTFWWGNSVLRVAKNPGAFSDPSKHPLYDFPEKKFQHFVRPIVSLEWMRESDRIDNPSLSACTTYQYQYTIRNPYHFSNIISGDRGQTIVVQYPHDINRTIYAWQDGIFDAKGFTCLSEVDIITNELIHQRRVKPFWNIWRGFAMASAIPIRPDENFFQEIARYDAGGECLAGAITVDKQVVASTAPVWFQCVHRQWDNEEDYTNYRDIVYHTIEGVLHHMSPTEEERKVAAKNGITHALPIDIIRSTEFVTKKGNIAKIEYPYLGDISANSIEEFREKLRQNAYEQWQKIVSAENAITQNNREREISEQILKAKALPQIFDWNDYLTDEMIEKLIQANNWVKDGITEKYERAVEGMLSYSGKPTNGNIFTKIPALSSTERMYEIAYLGLQPIFAGKDASLSDEIRNLIADNNHRLASLYAFNISDTSQSGKANSSFECAPPEWVHIFKWPSAVMCWIRKQLPPKIGPGQCGGNTIGKKSSDTKEAKNLLAESVEKQKESLKNTRVIPHFPRLRASYHDTISFSASLQDNVNTIIPSNGTVASLEILSVTSQGKKIDEKEYHDYFTLSQQSIPVASDSVPFLIQTKERDVEITGKIVYSVLLSDNTPHIIHSEPFTLVVSSDYLDADIVSDTNNSISVIRTDATEPFFLSVFRKKSVSANPISEAKFSVTFFDDIVGREIVALNGEDGRIQIPEVITKNLWTYRAVFSSEDGVSGEMTFSVSSGDIVGASIVPTSTMILKDSDTLATLLLQDASGNQVKPDIYSVEISVENGFIIDSSGHLQQKLSLDILDSRLSFLLRSKDAGEMKVRAMIKSTNASGRQEFSTEKNITVFDEARIKIQMENDENFVKIGGKSINMRLQITDTSGNVLHGFSSVVSLSLPRGAGTFSEDTLAITQGQTEVFSYTPGNKAGTHNLTINIPWIGIIQDNPLILVAGDAFYIDHARRGENIVFSLRDRFGNLANYSGHAYLSQNGESPHSVQVENGQFSFPQQNGLFIFEVPEMEKNILEFEENGEKVQLKPISKYVVHIVDQPLSFDFADDYNARYTVLPWGAYLREAEDLLYHTDPKNSQSLAATTLLESPYAYDVFVSVFPHGWYTIGSSSDAVFDSYLELERGFPVLNVFDLVRKTEIAKVLYQMQSATLIACEYDTNCGEKSHSSHIIGKMKMRPSDGYSMEIRGGKMIFFKNAVPIAQISNDGAIQKANTTSLRLRNHNTTEGLTFEILDYNSVIAEITYAFDGKESVVITDDIFANASHTSPVVQSSGYEAERFYDTSFFSAVQWVMIARPVVGNELDSTKLGPSDIDDLWMLSQQPGVGWMDDNRMLLSFAAGDTVGEATKWFHTYMMVNMGDPVASVRHGEPGTQIDGLDRTIGMQIADSRKAKIHNFFQKDMNGDSFPDIVVQYSDGYIELLLNITGKFRSLGNIAYLPRFQTTLMEVWDFHGDTFSDILTKDKDGKIMLLSNRESVFSWHNIRLTSHNEAPRHLQQIKIYDMDADGKDDIVYLTSAGELWILYGTETVALFEQKILDSTLGISLRNETEKHGGALFSSSVPQSDTVIGRDASNITPWDPENGSIALSDQKIRAQVYYQETVQSSQSMPSSPLNSATLTSLQQNLINSSLPDDLDISSMYTGSVNNASSTTPVKLQTFVRSQYASLHGMEIEKRYTSSNKTLFPEDSITVEITIQNTTNTPQNGVIYLDSIPKIFARDASTHYRIENASGTQEKEMTEKNASEFALEFSVGDIPANGMAKIVYTLKVLPASYGEMLVGDFEKWTSGHDIFGDVAFKTSTTCGAEMMTWLSQSAREYISQNRPVTFSALPFPQGIAEKISDTNNNNIPDAVEAMKPEDAKKAYDNMAGSTTESKDFMKIKKEWKNAFSLDLDSDVAANIEAKAQEIANGLSCGFGGGSCMSFPINWAPLAPGNDPVILWTPVGDGLRVGEWLPIFSALTGINVYGKTCYQVPAVWPTSSNSLLWFCNTTPGAGWYLGTNSPTNTIRLFVTPTLTLGMGAAVCLWGPANVVGGIPPKWLSPLIPWGNCIVMAKAMPICKGDGSVEDGDISGISGLGTPWNGLYSITQVWNGESCTLQASAKIQIQEEERKLEGDIIAYMRSPSENSKEVIGISARISKRNISSLNTGPLLNIGNTAAWSDIEFSVSGGDNIADISAVLDVNNKRISAFPDFLMDWLTRQTEEIVTSLFTPPNLTIIPPTDFGQNAKVDSSYSDFLEKLQSAYSADSARALAAEMSSAYNSTNVSTDTLTSGGNSHASSVYENALWWMKSTIGNIANTAGWWLNAIRAAYTFLGKLPFLNIREVRININIPWILPWELDQYERKLKDYQAEIERALSNWCASNLTQECLEAKMRLQSGGLLSSIQANLKRIEEYRRFPEKLQKYVTWKEKLIYDLLCNIEAVHKMTFGWIKDNGIRFQKWAELYVLIKAIAQSWQPLLDIFADTNASCGVCRNERHNSQRWKFKLISMIIPKIPVISFPKWPDIILDLSDVRLGIDVAVPDFNFRISPLRLPNLPGLSLPNSPTASLTLPSLPVLPALPSLPDLPKLPSLPMVKLPDLPPPPKLPKLAGSIQAFLKILKLVAKLYCYYQKTVLIPEWQVWDVIAQRTERQSTLPMDFIDVQFPQFSLPSLKEIRVSTHLTYMLRADFIAEFAKTAVKPINEFTTDLQNAIPSQIGENVRINSPLDSHYDASKIFDSVNNASRDLQNQSNQVERDIQNASDRLENSAQDAVDNLTSFLSNDSPNLLEPIIQKMETDKDVFLDTEEFADYIQSELALSGFHHLAHSVQHKMWAAQEEVKKVQKDLEQFNTERFQMLYQFLDEQRENVAEMQNVIDLLRSSDDTLLASKFVAPFASNVIEEESMVLRQLADLQTAAMKDISKNMVQSESVKTHNIATSLRNRVKLLVQQTPEKSESAPPHTLQHPSIPTEYLPRFEGMYVLTEVQNIQTKLFDYTDLIRKKDRVDVIDIDRDGDKDYIFLLWDKLYVKNTHLKEVEKIIDVKRKVQQVSLDIPEVPNNFIQVLSTPSEINASFVNTVRGEREWRMEFYDAYLEWDKNAMDSRRSKTVPKAVVDFVLQDAFSDFDVNGVSSRRVLRYVESGQRAESFVLTGPKIEKWEGNISVSISPNRVIYTGKNRVDITYQMWGNRDMKRLVLEPHRAYQFAETMHILSSGGPIFLIWWGTWEYRYSSEDNLDGVPILPNIQITSDDDVFIRDTTHSETIQLPKKSFYTLKDLWFESDIYHFNLPYPNGFYYARLHHLTQNKGDRAGVTLLSPQLASDSSSPVISLSETVRVPVYAKRSIPLSEIITEFSQFTVQIDEDVSVDADKNGVYDDDFTSNREKVQISEHEISFWPFTAPGTQSMMMRVRDEFGNMTLFPLTVDIYTPIPNVENVSKEKYISWTLDEAIEKEPIDIFRIRASEIPSLVNKKSIFTDTEGKFLSWAYIGSDQIVAHSRQDTFHIRTTGILENLPAGYRAQIFPATQEHPMKIAVFNVEQSLVYEQFLSIPSLARIISHTDEKASGTGNLVVTAGQWMYFVPAKYQDPILPWWAYITDNEHNALLAVAYDGNIYALTSALSFEMWEKDGFLNIRVLRGSSVVADFHYKMDFFYTTK